MCSIKLLTLLPICLFSRKSDKIVAIGHIAKLRSTFLFSHFIAKPLRLFSFPGHSALKQNLSSI